MFEIDIDTAQTLLDHIRELHLNSIKSEKDPEDLRYNYVYLSSNRCMQILDELITGYVGLKRFSESSIKITLTEKFMKEFNSIESKL